MRKNPHVRICGGLGSATTLVYPTANHPGVSPVLSHLARIIHEEADYSRKTNAPVWYKGCAHRPFATTEALA